MPRLCSSPHNSRLLLHPPLAYLGQPLTLQPPTLQSPRGPLHTFISLPGQLLTGLHIWRQQTLS